MLATMTSFGEKLQREREMRGVTLEEIAEATKIGTRNLRALETNDFDKLPGGIFNKGFVRAYARYLGIDEEQAVADYLAASGQTEAPATGPLPDLPPTVKLTVRRRRSPWRLVGLGVLLLAAAYLGWREYSQRYASADDSAVPSAPSPASETKAAPAPSTSGATDTSSPAGTTASPAAAGATSTPAPGVTSPPAASAPADSGPTAGFTLDVRAKRDCWVAVTLDGKSQGNQLMRAGSQQSLHASREIVLTVGNAGGLDVSVNGKPLPPQGAEGQKRTLTFTAKDAR